MTLEELSRNPLKRLLDGLALCWIVAAPVVVLAGSWLGADALDAETSPITHPVSPNASIEKPREFASTSSGTGQERTALVSFLPSGASER